MTTMTTKKFRMQTHKTRWGDGNVHLAGEDKGFFHEFPCGRSSSNATRVPSETPLTCSRCINLNGGKTE